MIVLVIALLVDGLLLKDPRIHIARLRFRTIQFIQIKNIAVVCIGPFGSYVGCIFGVHLPYIHAMTRHGVF